VYVSYICYAVAQVRLSFVQ